MSKVPGRFLRGGPCCSSGRALPCLLWGLPLPLGRPGINRPAESCPRSCLGGTWHWQPAPEPLASVAGESRSELGTKGVGCGYFWSELVPSRGPSRTGMDCPP